MSEHAAQSASDPINLAMLSEVSRLSTLLADRVLAAQAADQPILKAHINALLDAAIILDKYEVDLPAPLGRIVDQIRNASEKWAGRLP